MFDLVYKIYISAELRFRVTFVDEWSTWRVTNSPATRSFATSIEVSFSFCLISLDELTS